MGNVVCGIWQNKNNQVFVAQRGPLQKHGGYWEFPGGKVEREETAPQALIREWQEELALEIELCKYLGKVALKTSAKEPSFLLAYQIKANPNATMALQVHAKFRWLDFKQLKNWPLLNSDLALLPQIRDGLKS
jgi:8-oxo-dGTP diphosphatase